MFRAASVSPRFVYNDVQFNGARGIQALENASRGSPGRRDHFDLGLDHIQLSQGLWTGTLTATQVVSTFGRIGTGEVVLDFGATELHLSGLTSLDGLAATLILV